MRCQQCANCPQFEVSKRLTRHVLPILIMSSAYVLFLTEERQISKLVRQEAVSKVQSPITAVSLSGSSRCKTLARENRGGTHRTQTLVGMKWNEQKSSNYRCFKQWLSIDYPFEGCTPVVWKKSTTGGPLLSFVLLFHWKSAI